MGCGYIELWVYTGLPSLGLWEAGTFAATGRPARVRCGTQARQAVWLAMCVRITAMVQGNHGMVAQARRHLDPCVSFKRSANTSGTYENGATSRREYREARVLARIARALARYGRRVRWASLPAEQRWACGARSRYFYIAAAAAVRTFVTFRLHRVPNYSTEVTVRHVT